MTITPFNVAIFDDDPNLSKWIVEHGRLDVARDQIAHFAKYIPVGGVVVDAGASLGDHTATYSQLVGPTGKVFAFEPNPRTFEALEWNMKAYPNVQVGMLGLADVPGRIGMIQEKNVGASYLTANASDAGVAVGCVSLDSYLDTIDRLDFIHFDLEGFETRALHGARNLLAKFHPAIVLEINHACLARYGLEEKDVHATLASLNYRWQEIEPGHGSHLPQRDILALPA